MDGWMDGWNELKGCKQFKTREEFHLPEREKTQNTRQELQWNRSDQNVFEW